MTISKEAIEAAAKRAADAVGVTPHSDMRLFVEQAVKYALSTLPIAGEGKVKALATYDAGLLNDWGGGNVAWWQDYIRDELGRAHEFYADQFATAPISPDELLSLIPDEIDIPPMTDRGVAGQVLDVAWPLCGGNHQDGDFWSVFSFAVALTLRVSSPGKDGGQEVEAVAWRCKDFADGWILYHSEKEALEYQEATGCLMQPLYPATQPASTALVERLQQLHAEQHRILGEMLLDRSEEGQAKANWQGGKVNGIAAALSASTSREGER